MRDKFAVDRRECRFCTHAKKLAWDGGWICRKHLMGITPSMHVTFFKPEGTCHVPRKLQKP
jgi:hypothetical protein